MTEKEIAGSKEAQEFRSEALQEIQRKVGCLYTWMLVNLALVLVGLLLGCLLAALNWGALSYTWP